MPLYHSTDNSIFSLQDKNNKDNKVRPTHEHYHNYAGSVMNSQVVFSRLTDEAFGMRYAPFLAVIIMLNLRVDK